MKVTHENMMSFVLETLRVSVPNGLPVQPTWKYANGTPVKLYYDGSNDVVESDAWFGENIMLSVTGPRLINGTKVVITIGFQDGSLFVPIPDSGYKFTVTAKNNTAETGNFRLRYDWYEEHKEVFEYNVTRGVDSSGNQISIPPHTQVAPADHKRITAKVEANGRVLVLPTGKHLVPVTYRRNYEELIGLFKKEKKEEKQRREKETKDPPPKDMVDNYENHFISANPSIERLSADFVEFMQGEFTGLNEITKRVETDAKRLWELAIAPAQLENPQLDDRPLYWARIKMQVALKRHLLFKNEFDLRTSQVFKEDEHGDETDLYRLVRRFEELSRNYKGVDFSNAKVDNVIKKAADKLLKDAERDLAKLNADPNATQEEKDAAQRAVDEAQKEMERVENPIKVLVTGFDPFFLNEFDNQYLKDNFQVNILQSNPSGCVALNLDDRPLGYGFIQTMIFPVRYYDFDGDWNHQESQGEEGVVERYIGRLLEQVDMVVTVSQAGFGDYDIDVFATVTRGGSNDNLDFKRVENSRSIRNAPETIITNLPKEMDLHSDAEYNGDFYKTKEDKKAEILSHSSVDNPPDSELKVYSAPGGNYLSNEIFFRVANLRVRHNAQMDSNQRSSEQQNELEESQGDQRELLSGHFHIAKLQSPGEDFENRLMGNSLSKIRVAINKAIEGALNTEQ